MTRRLYVSSAKARCLAPFQRSPDVSLSGKGLAGPSLANTRALHPFARAEAHSTFSHSFRMFEPCVIRLDLSDDLLPSAHRELPLVRGSLEHKGFRECAKNFGAAE